MTAVWYSVISGCLVLDCVCSFFFFFNQKTAYEMRISDWSSDVCSSDLAQTNAQGQIVCGVNNDADPTNDRPDCVPINVFGFGAPSQEIGRASCRERVCQVE